MTHLKHPIISYGLVTFQFALIAGLLLLHDIQISLFSLAFYFAAGFIGLWAVKVMHLGHFNIVPDPKDDSQLVTSGPYRWVRHPMYLSLLIFFFPGIFMFSLEPYLMLYANLFIVLWLKLNYEEKLLAEKIKGYTEYQSKTHKLLPFIL